MKHQCDRKENYLQRAEEQEDGPKIEYEDKKAFI
jgi:hypothetical protein